MARRPLSELPYHRVIAGILERENPASFQALLPGVGVAIPAPNEVDQALLRSTYRLEPASHPTTYAALHRAATALGVTVAPELYTEEGGGPANATYVHVPGRAIVVVTGSLLDLLDDAETCAVMGHEVAHHVLWTADGGRYLAAARLLDAAEQDARTPPEYLETARRYRLATELFADRGAAVACSDLGPAVSGLVKVSTGLSNVDPEAYLRQATEIDFTKDTSVGSTHPETLLRAWALQAWWHDESDDSAPLEDAVASAIGPRTDLAVLDLLGQDELLTLTRQLVWDATLVEGLRAPEVVELAELYGVTPGPRASPFDEVSQADLGQLPSDTRRYLAAVLADLATASADSGHDTWVVAGAVARRKGLDRDLITLLGTELDLSERERARLRADVEATAAG